MSLERIRSGQFRDRDTEPFDAVDTTHRLPEIVAVSNEGVREINRQMETLPSGGIREATALYVYADFSCPEIATQLDRPVGTIKAYVHRGKKNLQELLKPWKNEEE